MTDTSVPSNYLASKVRRASWVSPWDQPYEFMATISPRQFPVANLFRILETVHVSPTPLGPIESHRQAVAGPFRITARMDADGDWTATEEQSGEVGYGDNLMAATVDMAFGLVEARDQLRSARDNLSPELAQRLEFLEHSVPLD